MRAMTSISVRPMSVPIENCRLMNAPPAFAKDWISWRPARPRSACSCGSISSDSTSVGAAARQPVKIVMTGSSMSGKSCTGSRMSATMPSTMTRPTPTATPTGLFNDLSVRFTLASRGAGSYISYILRTVRNVRPGTELMRHIGKGCITLPQPILETAGCGRIAGGNGRARATPALSQG